jgi:hypothetical protein
VNTETGEFMPTSLQVSPNWEVYVYANSSLYTDKKKFADFNSADAYAKRHITTECKKWVAK